MSVYYRFVILLCLLFLPGRAFSQEIVEMKKFKLPQVRQAIAVDKDHFFVINNSTITKHNKEDGKQVAEWDGTSLGIVHMNSGVVIKGKLYCVNTNYPGSPMASSVEIFDASGLTHSGNHSFGIFEGSATWVDIKDGLWYAGFAHYSGSGSSEGKDTRWTHIVKFNKQWIRTESWVFPEEIIKSFMPSSNSGGTWGKDGRLYCTGHDSAEIYVLEIPESGFTLKHVMTLATPFEGQGIAFDRTKKDRMILYGISRKENTVIVTEIK